MRDHPTDGCVSVKIAADHQLFVEQSACLQPTAKFTMFKVTSLHFLPLLNAPFELQQVTFTTIYMPQCIELPCDGLISRQHSQAIKPH